MQVLVDLIGIVMLIIMEHLHIPHQNGHILILEKLAIMVYLLILGRAKEHLRGLDI
jgi:hypothetical protein